MCDGGTTMYAFEMAINGRQRSKPTVMFFGLCNSPATFQAMMDDIFSDMIGGCLVIVYMDDILIFLTDRVRLAKITKEVLRCLRDNDLFLSQHANLAR